MSRQKISATYRLLLSALLAGTLAAGLAWAQARPRPLDAVLAVFFAADTATVESYLLESTKAQLQQLKPGYRQFILEGLRVSQTLEKEGGIQVQRVNQGNALLRLQETGGNESYEVSLANEQVEGDRAVVEALVEGGTPEAARVIVHLGWENGGWRLAQFELRAPSGRSTVVALDSPQFSERVVEFRLGLYEATAIRALRTLNTALTTYASTYTDVGYPENLSALGEPPPGRPCGPSGACLVARALACRDTFFCIENGYVFTYTRTGGVATGRSYTIRARPINYGVSGRRSFFTDESGVIRFTTEDRAATAADPPLQ